MKTSNKLLTIFVILITVIPVIIIVYSGNANYLDKAAWLKEAQNDNKFSAKSIGMFNVGPTQSFNAVKITNAKKMYVTILFIKDNQCGIKIPNAFKNLVKLNINNNGLLEIDLNKIKKPNTSDYFSFTILVYGPNIKNLSLVNAELLSVGSDLDSLILDIKNTSEVSIINSNRIKQQIIKNEQNKLSINNVSGIKFIGVNLLNSKFYSTGFSFQSLDITTAGKSSVWIFGIVDNVGKSSIKNLTINTKKEADINIQRVKIDNFDGNFSDETTVNMPAINLKQMYKK